MVLLKDVASVNSGKSFRQKIKREANGDCMVIQIKDVSAEDYSIRPSEVLVKSHGFSVNHLLSNSDIIFEAKGSHNFAVQYSLPQKATAVSLFFIIRPLSSEVLPEYLTWYLNASIAQSYFYEHRSGGSVGNIKKFDLENLPIELPTLEKQQKIVKLDSLFKEEQQLTKAYLTQKEKYLNGIFNNLIK